MGGYRTSHHISGYNQSLLEFWKYASCSDCLFGAALALATSHHLSSVYSGHHLPVVGKKCYFSKTPLQNQVKLVKEKLFCFDFRPGPRAVRPRFGVFEWR